MKDAKGNDTFAAKWETEWNLGLLQVALWHSTQALNVFFASVSTGKVCSQASQHSTSSSKDQVWVYLFKQAGNVIQVPGVGQDMSEGTKTASKCHWKGTLCPLWKVTVIRGGFWQL